MSWTVRQLTFGSAEGRCHAHSYYDIPVLDAAGERVLVHRTGFTGRDPTPQDAVAVGVVDADAPGSWTPLGESRAWSWQQGPMAQWRAGGPECVYNDRGDDGALVARRVDTRTGATDTLPRPCYALDPDGAFCLSLDMLRLDRFRPGYGYARTGEDRFPPAPDDDGVWRVPLDGGAQTLALSLERARRFVLAHSGLARRAWHAARPFHYWFNHVKLSPDGARFTVKLRWRTLDGGWNDRQGVSLTANVDGSELRLLTDATSHVMWLDGGTLYLWRRGELATFADTAPRGTRLGALPTDVVGENVHLRHLPPGARGSLDDFVFDTPYRETIEVVHRDAGADAYTVAARFEGHRPANGPYRCDLHPCPSADGRRIVVTSLADGGRQVYLLERGS